MSSDSQVFSQSGSEVANRDSNERSEAHTCELRSDYSSLADATHAMLGRLLMLESRVLELEEKAKRLLASFLESSRPVSAGPQSSRPRSVSIPALGPEIPPCSSAGRSRGSVFPQRTTP